MSERLERPRRFALVVSYRGTRFCGWQIQKNGWSIQAELESAIATATGETVRVIGSGRTDAGVHAEGQVASLELRHWNATAQRLVPAINQRLPDDVCVRQAFHAVDDFHAIANAIDKTYRYRILNARVPDPLAVEFQHRIPRKLDVDQMVRAAENFRGEHDFIAFETLGAPRNSTVRTILQMDVDVEPRPEGHEIQLVIRSNGFLYNMVRNMVGAVVEVGAGRQPAEWIAQLLGDAKRASTGMTVPAKGLCLQSVNYPRHCFVDPPSLAVCRQDSDAP